VLASGMISSAQGLVEVPHLTGPVGLKQLAQGMQQVAMPDVVQQPLWIIPGVRNPLGTVDISNFEAMDMMRGEEVEVMGLIARLRLSGPAMFILPGSHTKLVNIDEHGRITGCATTIAGELLQVITQGTLISQSLQGGFADEFVPEMVRAGALAAQKTGLARACFGVRTLANFAQIARNDLANFLLGAVLSADLQALKNSSAIQMHPETPIVISGKKILRQTLELLLQEQNFFYGHRDVASDAQQADLAGFGALCVAGARGLTDPASLSFDTSPEENL